MGMKQLLTAVTVSEIDAFEAALDAAWADRIVSAEEFAALRRQHRERVSPTARAAHDGTAIAHAFERGAVEPAYVVQLAERFRRRVEALPEPLPAA